MARIRPIHKEPLRVVTVKLTPTVGRILQDLSQDASDTLGWTVSSSAVVRAVLLYIGQQPVGWRQETLLPLIEEEIAEGRVWGKQSKKNKM